MRVFLFRICIRNDEKLRGGKSEHASSYQSIWRRKIPFQQYTKNTSSTYPKHLTRALPETKIKLGDNVRIRLF